jgi:hypothetical protein
MVRRQFLAGVIALIATAAPISGWTGAASTAAPDIAVIVAADLEIQGLTRGELREIILGNRRFWRSGLRVELVIAAAASPERAMFVEELSSMSELQFQQYWIGQVFRGRATSAPRAAPDRATALALVQALPGAVALMPAEGLPATVRVLPIDGHLPGDPEYPLR